MKRRELSVAIAGVLIITLLIGGLPVFSGVIIERPQTTPAFTLDLWHPLPGLSGPSTLPPVPLAQGPSVLSSLVQSGTVVESAAWPVLRADDAPEAPPPKVLS